MQTAILFSSLVVLLVMSGNERRCAAMSGDEPGRGCSGG
jgi:hypothetical protein